MTAAHTAPASVLVVRRSTLVAAPPARVWREFESFAAMDRWWGILTGVPEAGKGHGQRLVTYEPRAGGRIEMEVLFGATPTRYGGPIVMFDPGRELTFESDWIPNRGWTQPTRITLRPDAGAERHVSRVVPSGLRIHRREGGRGARRLRDGLGDDAAECSEKDRRRIA
jgi:uncharacterized protein YndB with AHSA1/START domain